LRLAEGSNINKSLLALGKVINKLSDKNTDGYVPYRDSKLTRLLKDSLGGNTKTILITCISATKPQIDETIHSLNYAARAKKIKLMVEANSLLLVAKSNLGATPAESEYWISESRRLGGVPHRDR
jgi:kinesin family member 18/19